MFAITRQDPKGWFIPALFSLILSFRDKEFIMIEIQIIIQRIKCVLFNKPKTAKLNDFLIIGAIPHQHNDKININCNDITTAISFSLQPYEKLYSFYGKVVIQKDWENLMISYHNIIISSNPSNKFIDESIEIIQNHLTSNKSKIFCYEINSFNNVSLILICYLIKYEKLDTITAYNTLRIASETCCMSLFNTKSKFYKIAENYEKSLH